MLSFNELIRTAGHTLQTLAASCGLSRSALAGYSRGLGLPRAESLGLLSAALGTDRREVMEAIRESCRRRRERSQDQSTPPGRRSDATSAARGV